MSVKQMTLVWDLDLAPNKRLVLLAYADHADDEGNNVFPSLPRIAHKTGYSVDQVRRLSRELVTDGLMELVERGAGRGNTHHYRLTLQKGSKLPAFEPKRQKEETVADATQKVASRRKKVAPMPPEPSVTIREPSPCKGASAPQEDLPAKALTTLTVDRVKEVGFDPASHQKQNWGKGWAAYVYVAEGETPPTPEEQFAALGEIVAAAAGKGGKPRYFLAVEDAVKRAGGCAAGNVTPLRRPGRDERPADPGANSEEAAARRTEGYEFFFG